MPFKLVSWWSCRGVNDIVQSSTATLFQASCVGGGKLRVYFYFSFAHFICVYFRLFRPTRSIRCYNRINGVSYGWLRKLYIRVDRIFQISGEPANYVYATQSDFAYFLTIHIGLFFGLQILLDLIRSEFVISAHRFDSEIMYSNFEAHWGFLAVTSANVHHSHCANNIIHSTIPVTINFRQQSKWPIRCLNYIMTQPNAIQKTQKDEMDSSSDYEISSHSRNTWWLIRVAISVVEFGEDRFVANTYMYKYCLDPVRALRISMKIVICVCCVC